MAKQFDNVLIENDPYEQHGKAAKEKILELIKNEKILVKSSFENSLNKTMAYQRKIKVSNLQVENTIEHAIIVPTFTDEPDIKQAIKLAHELGHYYVYKNLNRNKIGWLDSGFHIATYINEKLAWKKAKEILEREGIVNEKGDELQYRSFQDFLIVKQIGLHSYGHPIITASRKFGNLIMNLLRYLIISYFIVGALIVFDRNNIPVPIFSDMKVENFYDYWLIFFLPGVFILAFGKFIRYIMKNNT